jgi:hypothetical protein
MRGKFSRCLRVYYFSVLADQHNHPLNHLESVCHGDLALIEGAIWWVYLVEIERVEKGCSLDIHGSVIRSLRGYSHAPGRG